MEEIYLKGFKRRDWCSDKVHLKKYFEEYSNELSIINHTKKKPKSEMEILQLFVPQSNQLSLQEFLSLGEDSNGTHLTTLHEDDLIKKPPTGNDVQKSKVNVQEDCKESIEEEMQSKSKRNRINQIKNNASRKEISVDAAGGNGLRDLDPRSHFKVMFRVHEPFNHVVGDNSRPGRCTQEIAVLGHQPLTSLRDSIICESDFQDVRGDISENPDAPITERARDRYLSSMFYFDNTFYVDKRQKDYSDYSETIRSWGLTRGINFGQSESMQCVKFEDLTIRFGYPYVYMHQGCCEHIIYVSDACLLTMKDNLHSLDYPLLTKTSHVNMLNCMLCSRLPAKWIVRDCDRLAHNPTYECKNCFKSYHYINGKKIEEFKAFVYSQRSVLM